MVEIGRWGNKVPRYAWHTIPRGFGDVDVAKDGLPSYQPAKTAESSGEAEAIRRDFRPRGWKEGHFDPVPEWGIIWLAPEWPKSTELAGRGYAGTDRSYRVDLSKLDPARMRYSYGAEGYVWHLGPIPAEAIAGTCPDCEWRDDGGIWRTGVCDDCKREAAGTWCENCQGTGSPICCRCEGTHVDLNP